MAHLCTFYEHVRIRVVIFFQPCDIFACFMCTLYATVPTDISVINSKLYEKGKSLFLIFFLSFFSVLFKMMENWVNHLNGRKLMIQF